MQAPPTYSAQDSGLPIYAEAPATGERVLALGGLARSDSTSEYRYAFGRLVLNLGPKIYSTTVPVYGKNSLIEGYVEVKKFSHVRKVVVSISGEVSTTMMQRGVISANTSKNVLSLSSTLYSADPNSTTIPEEAQKFTFSFALPTYIRARIDHLPPSFSAYLPGFNADVRYTIKVDLMKAGLRRHETIKRVFLYLPRTSPPSVNYSLSRVGSRDVKNPQGQDPTVSWQTTDILPKTRFSSDGISPSDLPIQFSLPTPTIFPTSSSIPYTLSLSSSSPVLPFLLASLQIHLIKTILVNVGGQCSRREYLLGSGEVWRVNGNESGRTVVQGAVSGGKRCGECSWDLDGYIEVRYAVRLIIRPPPLAPSLGAKLPTYDHIQFVHLTTHDSSSEEGAEHLPALGMVMPYSSSLARVF